MSVFGDELLISSSETTELFIFSYNFILLHTLKLSNHIAQDATWAPSGKNIVYFYFTNFDKTPRVVVRSATSQKTTEIGQVFKKPNCFSVCNNVIFLTDWNLGVYQSTDDGISWSHVFKSIEKWSSEQVVNVVTNQYNDIWALESVKNTYQLSVYTVEMTLTDYDTILKRTNVTSVTDITLSSHTSLTYDGMGNIFISDHEKRCIYTFAVNGQYSPHQLLSLFTLSHKYKQNEKNPTRLAVDNVRQLLYVGQTLGSIQVYKLTHKN